MEVEQQDEEQQPSEGSEEDEPNEAELEAIVQEAV